MDTLQADIDQLESEKAELKQRLNSQSKMSTDLGGGGPTSAISMVMGTAGGEMFLIVRDVQTKSSSDVASFLAFHPRCPHLSSEGRGHKPLLSSTGSPVSAGLQVIDSPLLTQQIEAQRLCIKQLKNDNNRLKVKTPPPPRTPHPQGH